MGTELMLAISILANALFGINKLLGYMIEQFCHKCPRCGQPMPDGFVGYED